jgi:hypothetical protein
MKRHRVPLAIERSTVHISAQDATKTIHLKSIWNVSEHSCPCIYTYIYVCMYGPRCMTVHTCRHTSGKKIRTWFVPRNGTSCLVHPTLNITNSMVNTPSWHADSRPARQEIRRSLWNSNVHNRDHKSPPLDCILGQKNPLILARLSLRFALKNTVFWDVESCRYCVNRRFRGTYRLRLHGRRMS